MLASFVHSLLSFGKVKIMRIPTIAGRVGLVAAGGLLAIAMLVGGCSSAENKPAQPSPTPQATAPAAKSQPESKTEQQEPAPQTAPKPESPEKDLSGELEEMGEKPRDLGPPLVDEPDRSFAWTRNSRSGSTRRTSGRVAGRGLPGRISFGVLRHV